MRPPGEQRLSALLCGQERERHGGREVLEHPRSCCRVTGVTVGSQHPGHLSFERKGNREAEILPEDSADLGGVPHCAVHLLCDLGKM